MKALMIRGLSAIILILLTLPLHGQTRIHHIAEMNTEQIRNLDREKTVILMPGGILEEHGPYIPSFTDGYINQYFTEQLAEAIAARPGWSVVIFPQIPLGVGGANEIGQKFSFPGTYVVRPEIMRGIFMDLGDDLGQQGFKWAFIIHAHGAAHHKLALHEASGYFRDTYGGVMVNLIGLMADTNAMEILVQHIGEEAAVANGILEVHAGTMEHSELWYHRPDLVSREISDAKSYAIQNPDMLLSIAQAEGWPGYFGNPKAANPELGRALAEDAAAGYVKLALEILDGRDPGTIPRDVDQMVQYPQIQFIMKEAEKKYAEQRERQQKWIGENVKNGQ